MSKTKLHGFTPIVLNITRNEIEPFDLRPAFDFIDSLMASQQQVAMNAGRLTIQVQGYEKGERLQTDNRAKIQRYFKALDKHFDGWFHLCNRWDNTLRMLFLTTTELKPMKDGQLAFDFSALRAYISEHNTALTALHKQYRIPTKTTEHAKKLMTAYFDNYFLKLKEEVA